MLVPRSITTKHFFFKISKPTYEDAVENPRPVRGGLYVSVLVHSLNWWSHIEGTHLILETQTGRALEPRITTILPTKNLFARD